MPGTETTGTERVADVTNHPPPAPTMRRRARKQARLVRQVRVRAVAGGDGQAVEREVPVSIPSYRYATKEEFDREWLMAQWGPNDPDGPTVIMNADAPMLLEAIAYHQEQYPAVHSEEIQKIVKEVYGEVAVAKIVTPRSLQPAALQRRSSSSITAATRL